MMLSSKVVEAFHFAFESHMGRCRKGTEIPYIVHPMDVASILIKNGASESVVIAGLLHDVIEDAGIELHQIKKLFGDRVTKLVEGASEPEQYRKVTLPEEKKKTWKERKTHAIKKTEDSGFNLKLLTCADKLSNIRDINNDYKIFGEQLWDRLNASKEQQAWYYRSMLEAFSIGSENIINTQAYTQFKEAVCKFFTHVR
jgi:(p)ppGpp synthase/HD superfamily hydrolase